MQLLRVLALCPLYQPLFGSTSKVAPTRSQSKKSGQTNQCPRAAPCTCDPTTPAPRRRHTRPLPRAALCPSSGIPTHPVATMAARPTLFTRGLSGLSQSTDADSVSSPAEKRDDAKRNFLKTMRPLPTQHIWNVYFDRCVAAFPFNSPLARQQADEDRARAVKIRTRRTTRSTMSSSSSSARRSSRCRTSGATTTTPPSIRSACANPSTSSSRASAPCGRTAGTYSVGAGPSACPSM